MLETAAQLCTGPESARVLDVGCGPGLLVRTLRQAGHDARGVDISSDMIDAARAQSPANDSDAFMVGDAMSITFDEKPFDHIFALNLLFYHNEPLALVERLLSLCDADGSLVILNPHPDMNLDRVGELERSMNLDAESVTVLRRWEELSQHNGTFSKDGIVDLLKSAGARHCTLIEWPESPVALIAIAEP
jgi:SAM-dependent methyltransferase